MNNPLEYYCRRRHITLMGLTSALNISPVELYWVLSGAGSLELKNRIAKYFAFDSWDDLLLTNAAREIYEKRGCLIPRPLAIRGERSEKARLLQGYTGEKTSVRLWSHENRWYVEKRDSRRMLAKSQYYSRPEAEKRYQQTVKEIHA